MNSSLLMFYFVDEYYSLNVMLRRFMRVTGGLGGTPPPPYGRNYCLNHLQLIPAITFSLTIMLHPPIAKITELLGAKWSYISNF